MSWFKIKDNTEKTPVSTIVTQMKDARPLPLGRKEFDEWSQRIISGALVSADITGQKYALAEMIMHLGPTESHKPDAHFIHSLRKGAANQVAHAIMQEIYHERKAAEAPKTT